MRHLKAGRKFGRTSAHRKALFRNLVTALIEKERIRTTLPKAKELRGKVEKTITLGKKGTLHARRRAFRNVTDNAALLKLFGPLAEKYANRNGGYTRIIKIGHRRGDDAPMAYIELVEGEAAKPKEAKAEKTTRKKAPGKTAAKKEAAGEEKKAAPKAKKAAPKAKKAAPKAEGKEKKKTEDK